VYADLENALSSVDAALIESNYDPGMLKSGPYPAFLKKRIAGPGGHLSNIEAAEFIARTGSGLRWVCLGHLSAENNTPELALETYRSIAGDASPCYIAGRYEAGPILTV